MKGKAIEANRVAIEKTMIAFFERHYEEANEAINAITDSADNPVLLNMLAYIKYEKSGVNYERFLN